MKKLCIFFLMLGFSAPTLALAGARDDYNTHCVACHGGNAKTNLRRAKLLNIDFDKLFLKNSKMTREEMITITEKGKDRMPGFGTTLTQKQIAALVDFIQNQKKK